MVVESISLVAAIVTNLEHGGREVSTTMALLQPLLIQPLIHFIL
jgi:hypothetical protein